MSTLATTAAADPATLAAADPGGLSAAAFAIAADAPAGGAALDQVVLATAGATIVTALLGWLIMGHRSGRVPALARAAAFSSRVSGLPGWAALPAGVAGAALVVALVGMYWDIALHIADGRDEGPLANPAHYLILVGLYGVFAAGALGVALPRRGERPGPAALRIAPGWCAPVGAVLMSAAGAFALLGFPLDDVWHRLFGQDVTLWGPTHLMLIGGAGMTLVGQALLLSEGMRARARTRGARAAGGPETMPDGRAIQLSAGRGAPRGAATSRVTALRRVSLMGGLLIGLSTFQAEFDFGVPQYRPLFAPFLVALAAGVALVCARLWIGRGGAIGAALFFLALRGLISLLVGPVLGEPTPALPLYLGAAVAVELAALVLARRPLALGAAAGMLIGTVGLATEWAWSQLVMPLPMAASLLPWAFVVALVGGVAGGVVGALLGQGLRGSLPRPAVARALLAACALAVAAVVADGLVTAGPPAGARASVELREVAAGGRSAQAVVRVEPADLADDASWLTVTAWQGGGLHVDRLRRVGPGRYRTTKPMPLDGSWKAHLRLAEGRHVIGAPIRLPADAAIPAPEVPARAAFTRPFQDDQDLLQRERRDDAPAWLWAGASAVVLALYLAFLAVLAWGVGRVARRGGEPRDRRPPQRPGTPAISAQAASPVAAKS